MGGGRAGPVFEGINGIIILQMQHGRGCLCFETRMAAFRSFGLLGKSSLLALLADRLPASMFDRFNAGFANVVTLRRAVCGFVVYCAFDSEFVRVVCRAMVLNRGWVTKVFVLSKQSVLSELG